MTQGYKDPGVAMVAEFHETFQCAVSEEPWLPDLSAEDCEELAGFAVDIAAVADNLKKCAALANGRGRHGLGLLLMRLNGHVEETGELADALARQDIVEALDALTDTSYFVDGTYLTLGLGSLKPAADAEVHASNMSKLGADGLPIIADSGRIVKGPSYRRPDLVRVMALAAVERLEAQAGDERGARLVERWD